MRPRRPGIWVRIVNKKAPRIVGFRGALLFQPDVLNRLREMGLGEEQRIRLISRHPSLICQVCNARVALSKELAESILVEPLRKAS